MELLSTCRHVSKRTVCWNLGPILTTTRHFCSVFSKRRGLASSTRVGHNCSMDSSSLLPLREPDGLKPLMIFTFREGEDFYMHNFWDYLIKFCLWKLKLCLWKSKLPNNKERLSVCPVFVPPYNSGSPHPILTKLSTRNLPSLGMTKTRKKNFDFAKKISISRIFSEFFQSFSFAHF